MKIKLTMEVEVSDSEEKKVNKYLEKAAKDATKLGRLDNFSVTGMPNRPASLGGAVVNVKEKE